MRGHWQILVLLAVGLCLLPACSSDSNRITDPDPDKSMPSGLTWVRGQDRSSIWGGPHISLVIVDGSAELEFDCAHGYIGLMFDPRHDGDFVTRGTYTFEHPGPIGIDEEIVDHPAFYSGSVADGRMTLFIRLTDTGDQIGPFELEMGSMGLVHKCL